MKDEQVAELLYQAFETEKGGVRSTRRRSSPLSVLTSSKNGEEYLQQIREHEQIVLELMDKLGLDPDTDTGSKARSPYR